MLHIGIADYGMNVYYGEFYDFEDRLRAVKSIGYEGIERLRATDAADAMEKAAIAARLGMGFATCESTTIEHSIRFTAALGRKYVWCDGFMAAKSFDTLCRNASYLAETCSHYGIVPAIHNHLGTLVESQESLEEFLRRCPGVFLLLDVGHLGAAGGNVEEIFDRYYDRIAAIHLKDWKEDKEHPVWLGKGRFCALGEGLLAEENRFVVSQCAKRGFDGWVLVEQDTHLREPLLDLAESRKLIASWGA